MTAIQHERFALRYLDGETIRCDLRLPAGQNAQVPLVIICHGFKGFKNWGFHPWIGETLARNGFAALHFNFSLNGVGEDLLTFSELEKFRKNTLSREQDELHFVLDQIQAGAIPRDEQIDVHRVAVVGHSRGAFSALTVAAARKLSAVITYAGVSKFAVDPEREARWRAEGVQYVLNARTKERFPMDVTLLDDLKKHQSSIEQSCKNLKAQALIVHGDRDDAVDVSAATELSSWCAESRLLLVPGADHVFGARHPFVGTTPELDFVLNESVQFLKSALT